MSFTTVYMQRGCDSLWNWTDRKKKLYGENFVPIALRFFMARLWIILTNWSGSVSGKWIFPNFSRKIWMLYINAMIMQWLKILLWWIDRFLFVMNGSVKHWKNFLLRNGKLFWCFFSGYDGERNRCLSEISAEYRTLPQRWFFKAFKKIDGVNLHMKSKQYRELSGFETIQAAIEGDAEAIK